MKKLTKIQINQLNSSSEIENNKLINDSLGLKTGFNFDIWKDGCYLIEAKMNTKGFEKAQEELKRYSEKLKLYGKKLPKTRLILCYNDMKLYNEDLNEHCKLDEFDFDMDENYENYDITYENGENVAQEIYSRHRYINDGNIFTYFKKGIDWYNATNLDEKDFRLKLDLFNDPETQKKRGAFYTPNEYIEISTSYLREAIKNVPKGKDYVIIDRCAGTGQLEKLLNDEELSHCILSTIGIGEWVALWNIYGNKVRAIIPPFVKGKEIDKDVTPEELEKQIDLTTNQVKGADALQEDFYENNKYL